MASRSGALPRVLLADPIHAQAERRLGQVAELVRPAGTGVEDLRAAIADAQAVVVRTTPLPRQVLSAGRALKVIAKHGTGVDTIDVGYATSRAIVVARAGGVNAAAVAEYALAAILVACRPILQGAAWLRTGTAEGSLVVAAQNVGLVGRELSSQLVGIIGWGAIGRRVGAAVEALGGRVIAYDPLAFERDERFVDDLYELLTVCDIVTVHVPLNADTRALIGAAELRAMKPAAALINTARGGVVDEKALLEALNAGQLRFALVDVFEHEPPPPDDPLLHRDDVIATPHLGGSTEEAMARMGAAAAEAVLAVLDGRMPADVVNPEVTATLGSRAYPGVARGARDR